MGLNKAHGQSEGMQEVRFLLGYSGGTPSVSKVLPPSAADDISVADTAVGRTTVTIKNFKGQQGAAQIHTQSVNHFTLATPTGAAYSGDDLSFVVESGDVDLDDSSAREDQNVYVHAVAY